MSADVRKPAVLAICGAGLAIVSWALYAIPGVFIGTSLSNASGICSSGLGVFAQAYSKHLAADCGNVVLGSDVLHAAMAAGCVTAVVGALFWVAGRRS